jgi:hypothetical protein
MRLGAMNPEEPFSGITVPVHIEYSQKRIDEVIESSRRLYTKKWQEKTLEAPIKNEKKVVSHITGLLP